MNEFSDLNYPVSRNFLLKEFKVSSLYPDEAKKVWFTVSDVLKFKILCLECIQPIRDKFGKIKVLSGKRSHKLNDLVGGSETSDHLSCNAADLEPLSFNSENVFKWVVFESGIMYRQAIYYPNNNFFHISCNIPGKGFKHEALVKDEIGRFIGAQEYFK